jgi:protein O-GlcNAc transferase
MASMSDVARTFNDALAALESKNLRRAEELFKQILAIDKCNVPALNLLVVILISMQRFAEAETFIAQATSLNQSSDVSYYNYGLISKHLNKHHEALRHFGRALHLNPNVAETWNGRGTVFSDCCGDCDTKSKCFAHPSYSFFSLSLAEETPAHLGGLRVSE